MSKSNKRIVTGVALTPRGMRLPNNRRKKLHQIGQAFAAENSKLEKIKIGTVMLGRTTEAAQIEKKFECLVPLAAIKLKDAKRSVANQSNH